MIHHHPSTQTLLAHAAGTLRPGHKLVVDTHLHVCSTCQQTKWRLESLGGVLLEDLPPDSLAPDAFARALAALDETSAPPCPSVSSAGHQPGWSSAEKLPRTLWGTEIGRWLWIGPGIRYSRVRLPWAPKENVMLLRVAANRPVIAHSHGGLELTQILRGSYIDATGHYQVGDMAEEDNESNHQPRAGTQGCLCVAALEGGLRLPWLSRLIGRSAA